MCRSNEFPVAHFSFSSSDSFHFSDEGFSHLRVSSNVAYVVLEEHVWALGLEPGNGSSSASIRSIFIFLVLTFLRWVLYFRRVLRTALSETSDTVGKEEGDARHRAPPSLMCSFNL